MDHPGDRSERRAVRNGYVAKRKRIYSRNRNRFGLGESNPIKGLGWIREEDEIFGHLPITWEVMTEEQKKIREVTAKLDGLYLPKEEDEEVIQWGIYSKWNGGCNCYGCSGYDKKRQRVRMRRIDIKEIKEGLVEYQDLVEELNTEKVEQVKFTLDMDDEFKVSDDEMDLFFHHKLEYDPKLHDLIFKF